MGFLTSLFGGDNSVITILFALGVVLLLIVLAVWALKLVFTASGRVARGRNKRLSIVDFVPIDQKRQLVLIRRDDVEHLIMIGGVQELVIESGISSEEASSSRATKRPVASTTRARRDQPEPEPEPKTSGYGNTNRLRELVTQPVARKTPALRHTGLLRPVTRSEPPLIPTPPQKSEPSLPDSDMNGAGSLSASEDEQEVREEHEDTGADEVKLGGNKQ